ncbi:hypothetical protein ILYODFUR_014453 [Ilyodon furcidens]|uniref:Uncharacterized protein n=1 Tax=Ilyodon furcidens TaxID=33524 RepID=A0ABV0TXF6_9TELE
MQKGDIRYPRATTVPGPSEGQATTENIKCQVRGTCTEKGCGLLNVTIPGAAVAPKGTSLPLGKLIVETDNRVMVIFTDSQRSLLASLNEEDSYVMGLKMSHLL